MIQVIEVLTLERAINCPDIRDRLEDRFVLIYSGEHKTYWRPDAAGYTEDKEQAGVYSFQLAFKKTRHCGPEKKIEFHMVSF